MKLIKKGVPPCNCQYKLEEFRNQHDLPLGSVVKCDCGVPYVLKEDQRDGWHWERQVRTVSVD